MAITDFNSSMPVRSEVDGSDSRLQAKIVGSPTGTGNATQQMAIDSNQNAQVKVHGTSPSAQDTVLATSEQGEARVNGVYDAAQNTKPSKVGLVASTRVASPTDATQSQRITAIQNGTVTALDVAIRDELGNPYTAQNPLPVSLEESKATRAITYTDSLAVASGATVNVDYSLPGGKAFDIHQVLASASGKIRLEIQYTTDGTTFLTIAVRFNSSSMASCDCGLQKPFTVPSGASSKVRLVITNRDLSAEDIHTTLIGDLN